MKTIKQIAEEIGVSKQAIFKKIKKEPLSTSLQQFISTTSNGTVYIKNEGVNLIKQTFTDNKLQKKSTTITNIVDDKLILLLEQNQEILHKNLKEKDKQLEEKEKQISELLKSNNQQQQLLQTLQQLYEKLILELPVNNNVDYLIKDKIRQTTNTHSYITTLEKNNNELEKTIKIISKVINSDPELKKRYDFVYEIVNPIKVSI